MNFASQEMCSWSVDEQDYQSAPTAEEANRRIYCITETPIEDSEGRPWTYTLPANPHGTMPNVSPKLACADIISNQRTEPSKYPGTLQTRSQTESTVQPSCVGVYLVIRADLGFLLDREYLFSLRIIADIRGRFFFGHNTSL